MFSPLPLFDPRLAGNALEFLDETSKANTMGYAWAWVAVDMDIHR